ncbi:hypothetical protein DET54_10515 [Paenibacillus pabuli]|uniref:Phage protein n=1 Tax=Paenibacillus pabuli TaxID=1472 RepID=A0ABX9BKI5_9BACL|nr:hypothetical protein [Paenibacillus pabuli]RAI97056.1 hypothetical protein DET54_10515 [Paenibacillus pabuli]
MGIIKEMRLKIALRNATKRLDNEIKSVSDEIYSYISSKDDLNEVFQKNMGSQNTIHEILINLIFSHYGSSTKITKRECFKILTYGSSLEYCLQMSKQVVVNWDDVYNDAVNKLP